MGSQSTNGNPQSQDGMISGFETKTRIPTGLMACREGQPLFEELLHEYDGLHFKRPDGSLDVTTNVTRITNACLKYGFVPNNTKQTVNGFTLLPQIICVQNHMRMVRFI